jgi:hypothetical protein
LNEDFRLEITKEQIEEKADEIRESESTLKNADQRFGIVLADFVKSSLIVSRLHKLEY